MKTTLLNIFAFFTIIFILIFGWQALKTQRVYFDSFYHPTVLKPLGAKKILVPAGGSFPVTLQEIRTQGKASYYDYSLKGYPNYSKENYTAASRDYPRGTILRVCRTDQRIMVRDFPLKNILIGTDGYFYQCVDVRVNDYGPEHCADNPVACPERIIDLSSAAFDQLSDLKTGIIDVEITEL